MSRPVVLFAALAALALHAGPVAAQSYTAVPLPKIRGVQEPARDSLGFSPKGTYFWCVAVGDPYRLFIWTTHNQKPLASIPIPGLREGCPPSWSADEKTVAVATSHPDSGWKLEFYDAPEGAKTGTLVPPKNLGTLLQIVFTPDGKRVVLNCRNNNSNLASVHDTKTGRQEVLIEIETKDVSDNRVTISPDGKLLASTVNELKLWDLATGNFLSAGGPRSAYTYSAATFLAGGRELVAVSGGFIQHWDCTDPGRLKFLGKGSSVGSGGRPPVGFDGGARVAYASTSGVWYFDRAGKALGRVESSHFGGGSAVSPDGLLALSADTGLKLWTAADCLRTGPAWQVVATVPFHAEDFYLTNDATRVVALVPGKAASIDLKTGAVLGQVETGQGGPFRGVDRRSGAVHQVGRGTAATAVDPATGARTELMSAADAAKHGLGADGRTTLLAQQADGAKRLLACGRGSWKLFDDRAAVLAGGEGYKWILSDDPGGQFFCLTSDNELDTYTLATGKRRESAKLTVNATSLQGVARDGRSVYGKDGKHLWRFNVNSEQLDSPFAVHDADTRHDFDHVSVARKSPRVAVSSIYEKRVRVWDGDTRRLVTNLTVQEGEVRDLDISEDGTTLFALVRVFKDPNDRTMLVKWDLSETAFPSAGGVILKK